MGMQGFVLVLVGYENNDNDLRIEDLRQKLLPAITSFLSLSEEDLVVVKQRETKTVSVLTRLPNWSAVLPKTPVL